jgi:hypothetical protein
LCPDRKPVLSHWKIAFSLFFLLTLCHYYLFKWVLFCFLHARPKHIFWEIFRVLLDSYRLLEEEMLLTFTDKLVRI